MQAALAVGDTVEVLAEGIWKGDVGVITRIDGRNLVFLAIGMDRNVGPFAHYELKHRQQKLDL